MCLYRPLLPAAQLSFLLDLFSIFAALESHSLSRHIVTLKMATQTSLSRVCVRVFLQYVLGEEVESNLFIVRGIDYSVGARQGLAPR